MTALSHLRNLCDPDSRKPFLREPGLGCTVAGKPVVVAASGPVLLAVRSDRFDPLQGVPRILDAAEVSLLQHLLDAHKPDAEPFVAGVADLVLWCGTPYFCTGDRCEWPMDRGGVLFGLPIDRIHLANLLFVVYWLVQPLETIQVRRCVCPSKPHGDVLYFSGAGGKGEFLGAVVPLTPAVGNRAENVEGWPVFEKE